MKILLLETATDICSVALCADGILIAQAENLQAMQHAAVLTRLIEATLEQAGLQLPDMDAIALSSGPGSYTSLRVGASTAKGISYALDKPMVVIPTLQGLAWGAREKHPGAWYLPMIDARRQEVWMALYDENLMEKQAAQPLVLEDKALENWLLQHVPGFPETPVVLCGNGAQKVVLPYPAGLSDSGVHTCSAAHLPMLAHAAFLSGNFVDTAYFEPNYLKAPNITVSKQPILVKK